MKRASTQQQSFNKTLKNLLCLFSLLVFFNSVFIDKLQAQICCAELEINGSNCIACNPPGWTSISTPDMTDDFTWGGSCDLNVSSNSVDGGGISIMGTNEGLEGVLTGLIPGQNYSYGFEYACPEIVCIGSTLPNEGTLEFEIDGDSYSYPYTPEWEQIIVCFTASSNTVDISFVAASPPTVFGLVILDYLPCDYVEANSPCPGCCNLMVESDNDYFRCPGEAVTLEPIIENAIGDLTITWTSDPPEGVDYLDDPTSPTPIFTYPYAESFIEESFIFTIVVEDDICMEETELTVTVLSSVIPEFEDLELCSIMDFSDLPNTSDQGYTGTWEGDNNIPAYVNSTITLTFILDGVIPNCLDQYDYTFPVNEAIEPEFNVEESYCKDDNTLYELTEESLNGLQGFWSPATFNPSQLGEGFHDFIFEGYTVFDCIEPYELTIEITTTNSLNFNLPDTICEEELPFRPPSNDITGIEGTWLYDILSFDIINDTIVTNEFIPDAQNCIGSYIHTLNITALKQASFDIDSTYCPLYPPITLNNTSQENYIGQWQPQQIDFSNPATDSINLMWIPSMNVSCVDTTFITVYKEQLIDYNFDIPDTFCIGDVFSFQNLSLTGNITGSWTNVDLSQYTSTGSFSNLFTPDQNQCASAQSFSFEIIPSKTVEFSLPFYLCHDDDNYVLPTSSLNGAQGTWNETFLDIQSLIGTTVNLEFTPTDNCTSNFNWSIQVFEPDDIDTRIEDPDQCGSSNGVIEITSPNAGLEFSIDNGASWTSNTMFSNLDFGQYEILYRNISYPECIESTFAALSDPGLPQLEPLLITQDTSCIDETGRIEVIQITTEDLEYSNDDGTTWTTQSTFDQLAEGFYSILVRPLNAPLCVIELSAEITGPTLPTLLGIDKTDLTNCDSKDGTITISADGSDLEFRIDDTMPFQADHVFENLDNGTYTVSIRSQNFPDCILSQTIDILAPSNPELDLINQKDPTACQLNNGSIEVSSSFPNVEYSIDGEASWQTSGLFENLLGGQYEIIVRLLNSPNCKNNIQVFLDILPEILNDVDIIPKDTEGCDSNNGTIDILYSGSFEIEMSIDDGMSYQQSGFTDLEAGDYVIVLRAAQSPLCTTILIATIEEIDCTCPDYILEFSQQDIDCDNDPMGQINIIPYLDETILWDNGATSFELTDLEVGEYTFTISYQNGDCMFADAITIIALDPLDFGLQVFPSDCESSQNGTIEITDSSGGSGSYSYSINGLEYQSESGFYNLSPDMYNVIMTDLGGCITMKEAVVSIDQEIDIILPNIISIDAGESVFLNPLIDVTSIDSFEWAPLDYIIQQDGIAIEVQPEQSTMYTLSIYYGECIEVRSIQININDIIKDIYIPNIINPSDPNNSSFYPLSTSSSAIEITSFRVYDRWGNLVFDNPNAQLNEPSTGWSLNPEHYSQGVYVYMISYLDDGKEVLQSGTVTIIR